MPKPSRSLLAHRVANLGGVKEIAADLKRWRARGDDKVAIATVVATRGSAPRPIGSKLAISAQGRARRLCLRRLRRERGLRRGARCAGRLPAEAALVRHLGRAGLVGRAPLRRRDRRLRRGPADGRGRGLAARIERGERFTRTTVLGEGGREFVEEFGPPPLLLVFGAVDTAEALCQAAKQLGWRTVVADARAKFATRERIPSADELIVEWPDEVLAQVEPDASTAVVVLTHENRFDIPALIGALRSEAFYVGALGARRNQERRRGRLLEEGLSEEEIDRIAGPTGLDIGAESPAETAVSILGEILAVRAGRDGGRLKASKGRIHVEVS